MSAVIASISYETQDEYLIAVASACCWILCMVLVSSYLNCYAYSQTNSSRKRRKLDTDPIAESENEGTKDRPAKHVEGKNVKSQQEDVPKGKRKARKRRRLTLQGRGLKEVRKRQKAEAQDDDFGLYSSEGTESIFSEDESHGGRTTAIGSDTSTSSSDENGI